MKSISFGLMIFFILFYLSACTNTTVLFGVDEMPTENITTNQEMQTALNILPDDSVIIDEYTESTLNKTQDPNETNIEVVSELYIVNHSKDNATYYVILQEDLVPLAIAYPNLINDPVSEKTKSSSMNHLMRILDVKGNQVQIINLEYSVITGISFEDVNTDGYLDIVINTGGSMNETHELYIWDSSTLQFVKVIFEGFDMLSFFTVYDGYIDNFLRGNTPENSEKMKLIWRENTLIKEKVY